MKKVTIVAVNYNTKDLTEACLNYIKQNLDLSEVDVCVVDNHSTDGSAEYLRTVDWIRLVERKVEGPETGKVAHGKGLDAAVEVADTPFLLCIHTDTFLYSHGILEVLFGPMMEDESVVCVGSTEQVHRGPLRTSWRTIKKSVQYQLRSIGQALGLSVRAPRRENQYVRSHCTLWNLNVIKAKQLSFHIAGAESPPFDTPGYALQDSLVEAGYRIEKLPSRKLFKYMDHIHRGTIVGTGGYQQGHRRSRKYENSLASKRA